MPGRVLIVACGPSVEGVDWSTVTPGIVVIAINLAINWCPVATAFFSLDPHPIIRRLARDQRPGVHYFMAVPDDYGTPAAVCSTHREPREPGVNFLRRLTGDGYLSARPALSEDPDAIHTGNSAYGALGLAYHMRPERIAFVGLDASQDGHAYEAPGSRSNGSLDHLPDLFASAVPQLRAAGVDVFNGSPASRVTCFRRGTPQEALEWLNY